MFDDYVKSLRQSVQALSWSAAVVATDAAILLGSKVANASADRKLVETMDEIQKSIGELQGEVRGVFGEKVNVNKENQQVSEEQSNAPKFKL